MPAALVVLAMHRRLAVPFQMDPRRQRLRGIPRTHPRRPQAPGPVRRVKDRDSGNVSVTLQPMTLAAVAIACPAVHRPPERAAMRTAVDAAGFGGGGGAGGCGPEQTPPEERQRKGS